MENDMTCNTRKVFESINFDKVSDRTVIQSVTADIPISLGSLFNGDPLQTLSKVDLVCDAWAKMAAVNDVDEITASVLQEDNLWAFLELINITAKQIQRVIYFICNKALKSWSSLEEKEIGLWTAKVYLKFMQLPGCTAYSVYHSCLFRKCIECLQLPRHVESENSVYKWKDYEGLMPTYIAVLETLLPLLAVFPLGTNGSALSCVIEKLSLLVATELIKNNLDFDLDFLTMSKLDRRRYSLSTVVTSLAFQGLSILMNHELNGDKEYTYTNILNNLSRHILCTRIYRGQIITVNVVAITDNAVAFLCHNLKDKDKLFSQMTQRCLKGICQMVKNKAKFRSVVSQAILTIMFKLCVQDLADFLKWLLLLVDSSETRNRVFALEMLGLLLKDTPVVNTEGLPKGMEVYLTPIPLIFAMLTRCDDVSPQVRTKALVLISNHMYHTLNVLTERQEPEVFSGEEFEDEYDTEFNGAHRSFWYKFNNLDDILKEIAAIFQRRIEDCSILARGAALKALEQIIKFNLDNLSRDNLEVFKTTYRDSEIVIRKQTIKCLANILDQYPNSPLSQEYWLRCALTLVGDREESVQAKALDIVEKKFLHGILSSNDAERDAALNLLRKLTTDELLPLQGFLHMAFKLWKNANKLKPEMAAPLERSLGGADRALVWGYLKIYTCFCKIPSKMYKLAVKVFEKLMNVDNFLYVEEVLKVMCNCGFSQLDEDMRKSVRSIVMQKLEAYAVPVKLLPIMIYVLSRVEIVGNRIPEFCEFSAKMIQSAVDIFTPLVSMIKSKEPEPEALAIKSFVVVKQFCHIVPNSTTPKIAILLKDFAYLDNNNFFIQLKKQGFVKNNTLHF